MEAETDGVLDAIGKTPLVRLQRVLPDLPFRLYAKLEAANPGGSIKDRAALGMIRHAIEEGRIRPGTVIIESSSGNIGIGIAQVCLYYELRFICVVDVKTTSQHLQILRAYGAEVEIVETPHPETGDFLEARLGRVQELLQRVENGFWPNQYANPQNAIANHRTMEEIAAELDGKVGSLFCATSTCGTIRGCAEYARENGLGTKVYAVDAVGSVIFGGARAQRLIPGHGSGIRPHLCSTELVDRVVLVSDLDCVVGCRRLLQSEAILAGGSSGGVLIAVDRVKSEIAAGSNCVVILPDRGERYLNSVYSDAWVQEHFGDVADRWQSP